MDDPCSNIKKVKGTKWRTCLLGAFGSTYLDAKYPISRYFRPSIRVPIRWILLPTIFMESAFLHSENTQVIYKDFIEVQISYLTELATQRFWILDWQKVLLLPFSLQLVLALTKKLKVGQKI
ncbi:uncharacterized protein LOC113284192 isoform X5 [Papaver somniferum]|uniref:uncharacterized protein LOC113284192 isoform X5 n=1 Tax=Papaver somniferum TaxID=3469 RepID=UPI000E6FDC1B|nr:uncharacterized protein LOC113284192 isoform X5 [Papaver somniferum]